MDLILKNVRCLLPHPENRLQVIEEETNIAVKDGWIAQVGSPVHIPAKKTMSFKNLYVLPGLIDTQVHFREPGMEHKEDLSSGSRAALKGGVTAFFDMPNTNPPTVTESAWKDKMRRAENRSFCDFAFYLGADGKSRPEDSMALRAGFPGVKIFMGRSTGNLLLDDESRLKEVVARAQGAVAVHSEDEARLKERKPLAFRRPRHPRNHPVWRDVETALISTQRIVNIARKAGKSVHILHISSAEEMDFLKNHRRFVTAEVTPQHLTLAAPECYDMHNSLAQMNPPIRSARHRDALWKALAEGYVDVLGSDHAPHTLEEKQNLYPDSPAGFPGVQTMLPLMLDHVHCRRLSLKRLVQLLAHNPARIFKIKNQGLIQKGMKAHFTVVDLKARRRIEKSWLASKNRWSPFANRPVTGWPVAVFLYGKLVMREDEILSPPAGKAMEFHPSGFETGA